MPAQDALDHALFGPGQETSRVLYYGNMGASFATVEQVASEDIGTADEEAQNHQAENPEKLVDDAGEGHLQDSSDSVPTTLEDVPSRNGDVEYPNLEVEATDEHVHPDSRQPDSSDEPEDLALRDGSDPDKDRIEDEGTGEGRSKDSRGEGAVFDSTDRGEDDSIDERQQSSTHEESEPEMVTNGALRDQDVIVESVQEDGTELQQDGHLEEDDGGADGQDTIATTDGSESATHYVDERVNDETVKESETGPREPNDDPASDEHTRTVNVDSKPIVSPQPSSHPEDAMEEGAGTAEGTVEHHQSELQRSQDDDGLTDVLMGESRQSVNLSTLGASFVKPAAGPSNEELSRSLLDKSVSIVDPSEEKEAHTEQSQESECTPH